MPRTVTPLARAHQMEQARLFRSTTQAVQGVWQQVGGPSEQALAAWLRASVPVVAGAQQRSAALAAAYVHMDLDPALPMPRITPTLVTEQTAWMASPVLRVRSALSAGVRYGPAMLEAASYASSLASGDLQSAMNEGAEQAAAASGRDITGWYKVPDPDCCEWCNEVSDRLYYTGVPFHLNCKCGVEPVYREGMDKWDQLKSDLLHLGDSNAQRTVDRVSAATIDANLAYYGQRREYINAVKSRKASSNPYIAY